MKKKLPRRLYILRENAGTEDEYFHVEQDPNALAEVGVTRIAGVYDLAHVVEITAKTKIDVKAKSA